MRRTVAALALLAGFALVGSAFYLTRSLAPAPVVAPPEGARERATVVSVTDGDTLVVSPVEGRRRGREQRVRLIGLDAPETLPRPRCWARESTSALQRLVPRGSTVTLAFDRRRFDDHRRQLRYVWTASGEFVNARQLAEGNAVVLRVRPNVAHAEEFARLERQARAARKGLWGSCPDRRPPSRPSVVSGPAAHLAHSGLPGDP
ncbi:thermonuclease family protein [Nonomuraea dietziae]|uniref:thermonuclease family protein n=1 Tax=Nonomuraea dietziae TaxID=65515 RepID=UPI0033D6EF18